MCGICGEFRYQPSPSQANWQYLVNLMKNRGPDDEGLWDDQQHCSLGFRRLAILDLSPTGHQPMHTSNGRWSIVYNGEMYNYHELKRDLERRGVNFRSTGDTEVVLYALAEWGKTALERFNGMFALAVYDAAEKSLLLARDHAGIKPLYYLKHTKGVVFASQYDQIIAHPWTQDESIDLDAFSLYFQHLAIPAPHAMLTNTGLLEPGTWLSVEASRRLAQGRWFQFPVPNPTKFRPTSEAFEAVDAAVANAVRRQLISDVPVGTFLSGGIDSPLVTAKASAATNQNIKAFILATDDPGTDESKDAEIYAREMGIDYHIELITEDRALSIFDEVIQASSEPFGDHSLFNVLLITKAARQQVTVLLSGDGGDELFWGYKRSLDVLSQYALYPKTPRSVRITQHLINKIYRRVIFNSHVSTPFHLRSTGDVYRRGLTGFRENQITTLFPIFQSQSPHRISVNSTDTDISKVSNWIRETEYSLYLPEVLLKVDRGSMFNALEVRVPLLDREVIEVAAQTPWSDCVDYRNKLGKLPLRAALRTHVGYQTTKKRGFAVPMHKWLQNKLGDKFEDIVLSKRDIIGIPYDREKVLEAYSQHRAGEHLHTMKLWLILAMVMWADAHLCKQGNGAIV